MSDCDDDPDQLYRKFRCILKFIKANSFDHLKLKYGESLTNSIIISETWEDIQNSSKIVQLNLDKVLLSDERHRRYMKIAVDNSKDMKFIDFSKNLISDGDDLESLQSRCGWNLDPVQLDVNLVSLLFSLLKALEYFANVLPVIKTVNCEKKKNRDVDSAFDRYIKIGETYRTSDNYKNSNIYKLEELLVNRRNYEKQLSSAISVGATDKSFIALVAPSLTGKTQAAFTINKMRPLYFALDHSLNYSQEIYKKFSYLNKAIKVAAEEDYESLEKMFKKPKKRMTKEDYILEHIGSDNLKEDFNGVKFFTLGLLFKLIEDSELDEKGELKNGMEWMKFHAERDSFIYSAKSIDEIKQMDPDFLEMIRTKYYLFLDEFVGKGTYWAILIRNLARCIEIGVVVANTNTDISNLIGKVHSASSRKGKTYVWSFVVIQLDATDLELLKSCSDPAEGFNLTDKIKFIIENSDEFKADKLEYISIDKKLASISISSSANAKLDDFFKQLINNEIPKLRPGIAFEVFDFIMKFKAEYSYNFSQFIDSLIMHVSEWLVDRKTNITANIQGKMGTLALYLSNAFDKNKIKPEIEHRKSYLNDHLYYLNNPVDVEEWMFLTFPCQGKVKSLEVYDKIARKKKEWRIETTHFDREEMITLLSCLFMKSEQSVAFDLEQGHLESTKSGYDTSTTANPQALKLDGNKFEVLAAVSIIDASHRKNGSLKASLTGQNGVDFVKNILGNIIQSRDYLRNTELLLEFPESTIFDLSTFLENCKIPFLYPANLKVPDLLKSLTNEGIVKVEYCERTRDKTKIDFKFAFEYLNSTVPPQSKKSKSERSKIEKYYVVAECKNWSSPIQSADLITILEKAYNEKESFLSLLFCNSLQSNFNQEFHDYCNENDINVYKIATISTSGNKFRVEPLHVCEIEDLPQLIYIIFETKLISSFILEESEEDKKEYI